MDDSSLLFIQFDFSGAAEPPSTGHCRFLPLTVHNSSYCASILRRETACRPHLISCQSPHQSTITDYCSDMKIVLKLILSIHNYFLSSLARNIQVPPPPSNKNFHTSKFNQLEMTELYRKQLQKFVISLWNHLWRTVTYICSTTYPSPCRNEQCSTAN